MNENIQDNLDFYQIKFNFIDKDKDGIISYLELKELIKECNIKCAEVDLRDLLNESNMNEKGQINYTTFMDIIKKLNRSDTHEELVEAFKIFDTDNTKLISAQKLKLVLEKFDNNLKDEDVALIIKEYDLDQDGYLNFEEFCLLMKNK